MEEKNLNASPVEELDLSEILKIRREKLETLKVGELAIVQTDAGIHLVRRYPLETGAYANKTYSQWFTDSTYSVYDFTGNLIDHLLTARLAEYEDRLEVDLELLGSVSMKDAVPNYDFR